MDNFQSEDVATSYNNNIFILLDVLRDGNCFNSSIVKSDLIPCSNPKIRYNFSQSKLNVLKGIGVSRRILTM